MIKFWDPQAIADIYAKTPFLEERDHYCNCDFCNTEWIYECSKCGKESDDYDDFWFQKFDKEWNKETEYLRCPACHTKLLTKNEWRGLVEWKKTMYVPVPDEQFTVLW